MSADPRGVVDGGNPTGAATDTELLEHMIRLGCEGAPLKAYDCPLCGELRRRAIELYGDQAHWDSEALDV